MDSDLWIQILELVILLALSGFFSSAETAMVSVSKIRLRTLEDEGNKKASLALRILENQSKMLSAILIGNNLVNTSAASIASLIAYSFGGAAVSIATFIITFLILVFGEITPKTWATVNADQLAITYAPIISLLMKVLTPIIWFVNLFSSGILKLMGIQDPNKNISMTESELRTIVDVSHEEGVIEEDEKDMINKVFDLGDAKAKDVMVPRVHVVMAEVDSTYKDLLEIFREEKFTRIPIYQDKIDNIIGIVNMKDLLMYDDFSHFDMQKILRKPKFTYENKKVSEKKDSWLKVLLSYTEGSGQRLGISVILSVISIISGLMPYYCIYRGIDLYIRNLNQAPMQEILRWCLYALLFYIIKIVSFSASTWISHIAAYHILEGLRLRLTDRFLKAPLGDVEGHSIGEIKSIMVEKIENMEPPIAHMIPEGSGHILLPVISFIALLTLDWRIALASLVTVPLSLVFMTLTMIISGKSFTQYDESNAHMNSTIVEYIEGIEVIKAFGRAGTSYEKYAKAILDYKKFVVKWLSSTWITMKMTFALFPSTLLGTLPVGLYLTMHGQLTILDVN